MRKRKQVLLDISAEQTAIPQLLTIPQVAARLGVGRSKVYEFIKYHGLPVVKLESSGSRAFLRVAVTSLGHWVKQREISLSA